MSRALPRIAIGILSVTIWVSTVSAADFYVDAVNGNNANAGTSPVTAWKTLSHASSNTPAGTGTAIHLAPGVYSTASGETYPLRFGGQAIVGDGGAGSTTIDGGSASVIFEMYDPVLGGPGGPSLLRGLTVRDAALGIHLALDHGVATLSIQDCVFRDFGTAAIHARALPYQFLAGQYVLNIVGTRFENCVVGAELFALWGSGTTTMVDCSVSGFGLRGVTATGRFASMNLTRCRFGGCAYAGFEAQATGLMNISLNDCLLAGNASGIVTTAYPASTTTITVNRCTIASNSQFGLRAESSAGLGLPQYVLRSTLIHGNGTDYSSPAPPQASFSQIGGPSPLFRDAANGDFRVYFGSPVIDAGDPATPAGTPDLAGIARSIDGDLDTVERADIGCHEFRTLDLDFPGPIGTTVRLEIFGPPGGTSTMRLARGPLVAPLMTAFGEFDLNPAQSFLWFAFGTTPGPGTVFARTIPPDPIFIGQTYSFQGRVSSAIAPAGTAWSNAVSLTITP